MFEISTFPKEKSVGTPWKILKNHFFIDFFLEYPHKKSVFFFHPWHFFCPWHFRFWELSRPFLRVTGTFKEKFHGQSKIVTGIFSQKCHACFHGQIYENQKMSRVLFDIVTGICAAGAKKKESILQQCRVLLFFFFLLLLSRAFINVTPFFTKFVTGNFLCHGVNFQFLSRAFLDSKIVKGEILRHGHFFPKLSRGRKKVSRVKEKNTGKNIFKNWVFFRGSVSSSPQPVADFKNLSGCFWNRL